MEKVIPFEAKTRELRIAWNAANQIGIHGPGLSPLFAMHMCLQASIVILQLLMDQENKIIRPQDKCRNCDVGISPLWQHCASCGIRLRREDGTA